MTDDLVDLLSRDLRPVRPGAVARRLTGGLAMGGVGAVLVVAVLFGVRPDLRAGMGTSIFWLKLSYAAGLAGIGGWCLARLARPGALVAARLRWLIVPSLVVAVVGVAGLVVAPVGARMGLWLGFSWLVCPWLILLAGMPVLAVMLWVLRGLAPTRLALAGGVAGVTSGALAAGVYALHCPESGAAFVASWYTLGIVLTGIAGALAGPKLLRW